MSDALTGITHIVHISTGVGTACEHCSNQIVGLDHFAESVNHYITEHGYRLLHVGAEWGEDLEGPTTFTVAVVGK